MSVRAYIEQRTGPKYVPKAATDREVLYARLFAKIRFSESGCWKWAGGTHSGGYGAFHLDGQMRPAHRVVYELFVGEIPEGLYLDHLCDTPECVNPFHLEPKTDAENILRGTSPPAHNARKTHCIRGHLLSGDNLYLQPGKRMRGCRECTRERGRATEARKKALRIAGRTAK